MEKSLHTFTRRFSELYPLQAACTVTYTLQKESENQMRLMIRREGADLRENQVQLRTDDHTAQALLQFLYENAVPPEHLADVVSDCGINKFSVCCNS